MALKFCQRCKTLMSPHKKDRKIFFKCKKCGFIKDSGSLVSKEKISPSIKIGKGVVEDKNIFATYKHKCPKCGYDKVEVIDLGLFWSDEDNIYLLKCGKCGYSERVGEVA
ncbi:MAG: hypothetical protein KKF67_03305 [Nanoarchaeota archaeon]|nr:hypothetical protein [Nanoarchaeota archaeon]